MELEVALIGWGWVPTWIINFHTCRLAGDENCKQIKQASKRRGCSSSLSCSRGSDSIPTLNSQTPKRMITERLNWHARRYFLCHKPESCEIYPKKKTEPCETRFSFSRSSKNANNTSKMACIIRYRLHWLSYSLRGNSLKKMLIESSNLATSNLRVSRSEELSCLVGATTHTKTFFRKPGGKSPT